MLGDGEQNKRAIEQGRCVLVIGVDRFEPQGHGELEFDVIAALPFAVNDGEGPGIGLRRQSSTVDRDRCAVSPCRYSQPKGELHRFGRLKLKGYELVEGIVSFLCERDLGIATPLQRGREVEI